MIAKWQARQGRTESTNQAVSKAAMKGTAMLITVSLVFIFLMGPEAVCRFYVIYAPQYFLHCLLFGFVSLMEYLNHSINGFMYCIVGARFRNELLDILCCRKIRSRRDRTKVSRDSRNVSSPSVTATRSLSD